MNERERIEADAARWLARQDAGRWTADDQRALDDWLRESTAHRVAWLRLDAAWRRVGAMADLPSPTPAPAAAAAVWPPAGAGRRIWITFGAAAAVVTAAAWLSLRVPAGLETYSTAVGARESVSLADGSHITLNTHTRARSLINASERRVWIDEGEVFFQVQHDPTRPFVVTAGSARITVLGTQFRVRHERGRTEVTVLEGRVQFDSPAGAKVEAAPRGSAGSPVTPPPPLRLARNEAVVTEGDSLLLAAKTPEQVRHELSWRQGRLEFEERTLGEIAAEFNRYNRKQLAVDPTVADLRLGGSFEADNVVGFVRLVRDGFGLKVSEEGSQVRLSR
jgi:transmembrane sensor